MATWWVSLRLQLTKGCRHERAGLNDYYMPFYLQHMREQHTQLASLRAQVEAMTSKNAAKEQAESGASSPLSLSCWSGADRFVQTRRYSDLVWAVV